MSQPCFTPELANYRPSSLYATPKHTRSKRDLSEGAITKGRMSTKWFVESTRGESYISVDRGYTAKDAKDADGFTVTSSQPTRWKCKFTSPKAGKSYIPSARSIDSIINCMDAVLSDPNVGESFQGVGGCSGAVQDNCIHPSVKDIIVKQSVIIADLSANVSFLLSYLGLQDMPNAGTSLHEYARA